MYQNFKENLLTFQRHLIQADLRFYEQFPQFSILILGLTSLKENCLGRFHWQKKSPNIEKTEKTFFTSSSAAYKNSKVSIHVYAFHSLLFCRILFVKRSWHLKTKTLHFSNIFRQIVEVSGFGKQVQNSA